jgi:AcrR family transcriptional regulator
MIDAAEKLVAERGFAACSLREVQALAGQRNKSAAHYHFGSLAGLVEAIVETRMAPINAQRLAMLEALDAAGQGDDLRSLVEAMVDPLADNTLGRPGSAYARFLAQVLADPKMAVVVGRHLQAESFRIVRQRIATHLAGIADLPAELRAARAERVVGLAIVSLAAWEDLPGTSAAQVSDLIDACVAVLGAPVSARTRSAVEGPDE